MRKFQFSLETLLSLRQARMEEQEQKLAATVASHNRERECLRSNREAWARTWAGHSALEPRKSHADYLYLERLERQSRVLDEKMHEARRAMEQEQRRYADMRKDLRVLERLRECQYREHRQKRARKQDEANAEISRAHLGKSANLMAGHIAKEDASWSIP